MELMIISELILNFEDGIIPIFAKLRNTELATFRRALPNTLITQ
jgi:hypothetical protein